MTPEQLSLYLEDRLEDDAREHLEEHLSRCLSCRRRLVEAYEAARPEPAAEPVPAALVQRARALARRQRAAPRRRASLWWGTAAAANAAIVSLVALDIGRDGARPPTDPDALRSGDHGALRLQAVAPDDGAVVTGAPIALRWTALPGATRTTVTLVDPLGNIVLRTTTAGDHLLLDPAATDPPLEPGTSWFWYVTVDLADGTSLESEVRAFTLAAVP